MLVKVYYNKNTIESTHFSADTTFFQNGEEWLDVTQSKLVYVHV